MSFVKANDCLLSFCVSFFFYLKYLLLPYCLTRWGSRLHSPSLSTFVLYQVRKRSGDNKALDLNHCIVSARQWQMNTNEASGDNNLQIKTHLNSAILTSWDKIFLHILSYLLNELRTKVFYYFHYFLLKYKPHEQRNVLPPGFRFFGCGVTAEAAPEDLRDLKKEQK